MPMTTYDEFDRSLAEAGSGVEAAEAHGCLCGALCAEESFQVAEWAVEILPDDAEAAATLGLVESLVQIREDTLATLAGDEMTFQPMLPPDTGPLDGRVRALAAWCSGFLYGLGRSGRLGQLPGDLEEIMRDFSEISRAAIADAEAGDEAEGDYTDLVEFVRASVQLAYEELAPQRALPAAAAGTRH